MRKQFEKKILMVCLGNICRSPLAEGICQKYIDSKKLNWFVDSAGTSGWHNGKAPDPRSISTAKKYGISIDNQRSRKVDGSDFDRFDLILVMDQSNYRDVLNMASSDEQKAKVKMILNYAYPNSNKAVPDPYYEGGFDGVYQMLDEACRQLVEQEMEVV